MSASVWVLVGSKENMFAPGEKTINAINTAYNSLKETRTLFDHPFKNLIFLDHAFEVLSSISSDACGSKVSR